MKSLPSQVGYSKDTSRARPYSRINATVCFPTIRFVTRWASSSGLRPLGFCLGRVMTEQWKKAEVAENLYAIINIMRFKNRTSTLTYSRCGQSLAEIIIGMAIGVFLIMAGIGLMVPAMNTNTQVANIQRSSALAKELLDNVRVWSEMNWKNVLSLSTGTANHYYLIATSSPFASSSGSENLTVSTTTYTRYFYIDDAYRDASGDIVTSGGAYDPSTKQIVVVYSWPGSQTYKIYTYLTRNSNNIYYQADWSGGPGATSAATSVGSMFATSSNINYTTTTGSIYVNIPGL